jgi:hypothetical protein
MSVFPCLFKTANRDLMKRGKQNMLFVQQTVHETTVKRNIYANMYDTARQCQLIVAYKLHFCLLSELCFGIIPLFIRN